MTSRQLCFALLPLMLAFACDPSESFGAGDVRGRGGVGSIVKFNTNSYAGIGEFDTQGQIWGGVRLSDVQLVCPKGLVDLSRFPAICATESFFSLDDVWSEAGGLYGVAGDLAFSGVDFLNSEWYLELHADSQPVDLQRLTIRYHDDDHPVPLYGFERRLGPETWEPVCEGTGPIDDVVLGDISVDAGTGVISERPGTLYIACSRGAIGKAIRWGYTPWGIDMEDFTGTVRMIRADYCGDGHSWTAEGVDIEVADIWGINQIDPSEAPLEAIWSANGALCVDTRRVADPHVKLASVACEGKLLPKCDLKDPGMYPDPLFTTTYLPNKLGTPPLKLNPKK